jgi:SAM-dependent methyltransferase
MDSGRGDAMGDRKPKADGLGRAFWEERWSEVVRAQGAHVAQRPASQYLTAAAEVLVPGLALDAGCGHGSEATWLAARGWEVTAVDFSATALAQGRSRAATFGPEVARRIDWVEADLGSWEPEPGRFDLVSSLYVHVAGSVGESVAHLAAGTAPGGTLLLVGHLPIDPVTGAETSAVGQVQVTVDAALEVLDPGRWEVIIAEERPRAVSGSGFDAVVCARRHRGLPESSQQRDAATGQTGNAKPRDGILRI